VKC